MSAGRPAQRRSGPLLTLLGSRSIRTKLGIAFGTLLALGALNIGIYYWGAWRRAAVFEELQRALERQTLLIEVVHRLEDQKRLVDLAAGALGVAEAPREEERRAFARDVAQVTDSIAALRARAGPETASAMAELERAARQLAADWTHFYNSMGIDPAAAVVASVRAEQVAQELLRTQLPAAVDQERQRVVAASSGFERTDRTVSRVVLTIFLLSALLGALAALGTSRHVLHALDGLRQGVERIGAGDLGHRIAIRNRDELGEIADRFNDMAERLRVRSAELQQSTAQLEHEIAQRRQAQEELEDAKEAAEAANEAKSRFLANMSHELRTPLNAIIGYSEMLIEEAGEEGHAQSTFTGDLEKIRSAGRHLLGLINDILDLSKVEAGKMELHAESFDLAAVLHEVADTVEPLVARGENVLERQFGPELGLMLSDVIKVREVLLNLLGNAAKFTERGRIVLAAERITDGGRSWVNVSVTDTGIGMTPDQMGKLFQPFTQASAAGTSKYGGTGLGLAISKLFIELMGGDITVESAAGLGATFTFRLPTELPAAIPEPPMVAPSVLPQLTSDAERPTGPTLGTVLIIDDDGAARDVLARTLTREGFRVLTADNGEEGLRLARESAPDVITLDILMPGQDGWAVLRGLKADPELCDVPVVMVTMVDERARALQLGAAEYLVKPVERERLLGVLRRQLAGGTGSVLVIEDDGPTRDMLSRMLRRDGWSVLEAADGRSGLELVTRCRPALVLLDLLMPDVDGFEFLERLDATAPVPVVVLTAKDLTKADVSRLKPRVRAILQKASLRREDLLQEVRRHVSATSGVVDS